jgi:hypothetical protein
MVDLIGKRFGLLVLVVLASIPCFIGLAYCDDLGPSLYEYSAQCEEQVSEVIEANTHDSIVPEDVQEDAERQFRPPEPVCLEPCLLDDD